jgi:hypothetical protein
MARLTKRDVEAMLAAFDADPVAALRIAFGRALDRPGAAWPELVAASGLSEEERDALLRGDAAALDAAARTLNELRSLPGTSG